MSKVIPLFDHGGDVKKRNEINATRREYGLSLLQGAKALNISASELEKCEASSSLIFSLEEVRRKFEEFFVTNGASSGKNLVFRIYPMRVAREILDLPLPVMARKYGYKVESWKKIESNARPISEHIMKIIETDVREHFSKICDFSAYK